MLAAPNDPGESTVDVNEAARMVGRSPETVRRWIWSGKLAAQKQGRRLMIPRHELAAFVAELDGAEAGLTLAEWAAAARQALVASGGPTRGSAADLVLADRRRRSEEPARL
jgi:excisionase family DNA binding protein